MKNVTDNHWHRIEELRHQRHAEIREQARDGDGTIERGEQELARIRAAKHRNEIAALKAALNDANDQLINAMVSRNVAEFDRQMSASIEADAVREEERETVRS